MVRRDCIFSTLLSGPGLLQHLLCERAAYTIERGDNVKYYELQADGESVEELTIEDVNKFTDSCILGRSVGLEILGRLLYCTYDRDSSQDFETERVLQLAQLDWSRKSHLWEGNVVLYNSTQTNNKSYKISSNASSVKVAVSKVKAHLGWI